jgi:hypothetical protein
VVRVQHVELLPNRFVHLPDGPHGGLLGSASESGGASTRTR